MAELEKDGLLTGEAELDQSATDVTEALSDIDKAKKLLACKVISSKDIAEDSELTPSMVATFRRDPSHFEMARIKQIKALAKAYDAFSKQVDFTQPEKIRVKHFYVMAD